MLKKSLAFLLFVCILVGIFIPGLTVFPASVSGISGDNFVAGTKDANWTILKPETETYSLDKGLGLRLVAKKESITGTAEVDKEWRNVFVRPTEGDFEVVAKTFYPVAPKNNYQHSALLIYEDEDNYVKVDIEYNTNRIFAQFLQETGGTFSGRNVGRLTAAADGSLTAYYKITKVGNTYTGAYSLDGLTYTNIGTPITVAYGAPKIGLYATKHTQTSEALIDTYFEYVSILSQDGVAVMTPSEMLTAGLSKAADYVLGEIPNTLAEEIPAIRVPRGYGVTFVSSDPTAIASDGKVTRSETAKTVNLSVQVSDGTRSATSASVAVQVPATTTGDNFVAGTMDANWTILKPEAETYSLDKGLGLRLVAKKESITGTAEVDKEWRNVFARPTTGDFEVVAKTFYPAAPKNNYQHSALLIYDDEDNYVKVDIEYNTRRIFAQFLQEKAGAFSGQNRDTITAAADGSLTAYYKIKKVGNTYTGAYSLDGLNYITIGNPITVEYGVPKIGLYATKHTQTTEALIDTYFEYVSVLSQDGLEFMTPEEMLTEGLGKAADYVLSEIPNKLVEDIPAIRVPRGYEVSFVSSDPSAIASDGKVTRSDAVKTVNLAVRVSDGTRSATSASVAVKVANITTGDNFVDGTMDTNWSIQKPETDTYSLDKGLGLRLVAKKESITGTAEVDKEWRNVFVRPTEGDFEVVAKTFYPAAPKNNYQHSALLIYDDEDNYVKVDIEYNTRRIFAQFLQEKAGAFSGQNRDTITAAADGSLTAYYKITKVGNTYTGAYSLNGITYITIGNPITVEYGEPKIGLYATKHTQTSEALIDTYFEYVSILSRDGVTLMTPEEMLTEGLSKTVDYVLGEIPSRVVSDISGIRVPRGYQVSFESSDPTAIASDGKVTRSETAKTVDLVVQVSDGTRSVKSETITVEVAAINITTGDNFVAGTMDKNWTIIKPEEATYSLDKGRGLRLVAKKESITGTALVDKEWRNVFVRPTNGDFEVVAKTFYPAAPKNNYQHSALLIYDDEDNYMKVDIEYNTTRIFAQFLQETNGTFSGRNRDTIVAAADGSLTAYYRIKKVGNTYTGSYSLDGINYLTIGNPITVAYGAPKIGLYATKHTQTSEALIDTYFEYVSVLSQDGLEVMTTEEMMTEGLAKAADYVLSEIPKTLITDIPAIRVPRGYQVSFTASDPSAIASDGTVTWGAAAKSVDVEVTVSDGTRSATSTSSVTVEIPKGNVFMYGESYDPVTGKVTVNLANETPDPKEIILMVGSYDALDRLIEIIPQTFTLAAGEQKTVEAILSSIPGNIKIFSWNAGYVPYGDSITINP